MRPETTIRVVHHDHELFDNFQVIAYLILYSVRNNQKKVVALRCPEVLTRATPLFGRMVMVVHHHHPS